MNNDDYNKIADLVDERVNKALDPIKSDLTVLKSDLTELKSDLTVLKSDLTELKSDLTVLKQDLKEVKDTQEKRVLPPVVEIETTIKAYADSYKINKHNIERVDTRLSTIEDELNIEVPEDLKVPHFASQAG